MYVLCIYFVHAKQTEIARKISAGKKPVTVGYSSVAAGSIFLRYLIKGELPHLHNTKDSTFTDKCIS